MRPDLLALALLLAAPAGAEEGEGGDLWGRRVLVRVETWDDPARPLIESRDDRGMVGKGPEFGVGSGGSLVFGVVPVRVDPSAGRIDLGDEGQGSGAFAATAFNGYVLTFPVDRTLLTGAALDPAATTLPLGPEDVTVEPQALRIHVGGLAFDESSRIGVTLEVTDCVLS